MEPLHQALRWLHIVFGTIGLVLFWIPVLSRKGGRTHRTVGKWFIRCAVIVAASALCSCLWVWISPTTFLARKTVTPETANQLRFFFGILGVLGFITLQAAQFGARSLRCRDDTAALGTPTILICLIGQVMFSASMLGWCALLAISSRFETSTLILVILSLLGLLDANQQRAHFRPPECKPRLQIHIESMIGCGVAFHTAALVTIINRFTDLDLPGPLVLIPWILPSLIGIPAIALTVRHHVPKES